MMSNRQECHIPFRFLVHMRFLQKKKKKKKTRKNAAYAMHL